MTDRYLSMSGIIAWLATQDAEFTSWVRRFGSMGLSIRLGERRQEMQESLGYVTLLSVSSAADRLLEECSTGRLLANGIKGDAEGAKSQERVRITTEDWLDLVIETKPQRLSSRPGRFSHYYWFPYFSGKEVDRAWDAMNALTSKTIESPLQDKVFEIPDHVVFHVIPETPRGGQVEIARLAMFKKWPNGKIPKNISISSIVDRLKPILAGMNAPSTSEDTVRRALGLK